MMSKSKGPEGIRRQAQELIDQAYERGFKDGYDKRATDEKDAWESAEDEAYQRGADDAWEAAKKIYVMFYKDIEKIFGKPSGYYVYLEFSASEAIAKIKAYEEQKKAEEEIKVGDEVICECPNRQNVIVTAIDEKDTNNGKPWITIMRKDGACYGRSAENIKKTGRSFPQIAEVLKQMQEGEK